jgi:hypothetical protein
MRKSIYLLAVVAITLMSLGFLAKSTLFPIENSALQLPATISIDELHRSIDMKALPVHVIKDPV